MKRWLLVLGAAWLLGAAQAQSTFLPGTSFTGAGAVLSPYGSVALRPQGDVLKRAVTEALAFISSGPTRFSTISSPAKSGPLMVLGGDVPFNPDVSSRTVTVGGTLKIEFNPNGPLPLQAAVRTELGKLLGLSDFTPQAARIKLSGADLNNDGNIDLVDLALLMGNYGKSGVGDLNKDGRIDDTDLKLFTEEYQLP